jgi:hypothetical protein
MVDSGPPAWVGVWHRLDGPQQPRYHVDLGVGDDRDAKRCARFAHRAARKRLFPWQWEELRSALLRRPDGLWLHRLVCWVITRQQGKTEVACWITLFGLFVLGETIVYSAQRGQTSDAVFARVVNVIKANSDLLERVIDGPTGGKQGRGDVTVRALNGRIAHLRCGVRSVDLGRGLDMIDRVIFDEAYNLTEAETAALTGAQIAAPNAQTLYISTAPVASIHAFCDIFTNLRNIGLAGWRNPAAADPDLLYSEYCAPDPPNDDQERAQVRLDHEMWRLASPSHGVISKDRDIEANRKVHCINAEGTALWEADYLGWGQWPSAAQDREPVIPVDEVWLRLVPEYPSELSGQTVLAVSRSQDLNRWYIAAGRRTVEGRVMVEVGYGCRVHIGEVARYLLGLIELWDPAEVVVEGHDPGKDLAPVMRKLGIDVHLTSANEFSMACAGFIDAAFAGDIEHHDQPIIRDALEVAQMRELPRGDRVFDTRDGDIACLIAYVLAHWAVLEFAADIGAPALPAAGGGDYNGGGGDSLTEFETTSSGLSAWDMSY